MIKTLSPNKYLLLKSDVKYKNQYGLHKTCIVFCACTALIFGALLTYFGCRVLLTESDSLQTTFTLIATRSAVSISVWTPNNENGKPVLKIDTAFTEEVGNPRVCDETGQELCLQWIENKNNDPQGIFQVKEITKEEQEDVRCYEHAFLVPDDSKQIVSCISLQGAQLYGGTIRGTQYWPSQNNNQSDSAFVTGLGGNEGTVERYWLTSTGTSIFVPSDIPLFVSQNETKLCLTSKIEPPYLPDSSKTIILRYDMCTSKNPVTTHLYATRWYLGLPRSTPDERMFQHPIWSTWARYKKIITTFLVTDFANQIVYYGFNNSQLEIDDNWESCYGSAKFYSKTFTNPKLMIADLKSKGFRVTLWTHPFINIFCDAYITATDNGYLAKSAGTTQTTMTYWWDGMGGIVNFTNPEAVSWWKGRLQNLSTMYNIDAFKYDAGEAGYLPGAPYVGKLNAPVRLQPNIFTTQYVRTVASVSDLKLAEVRVVYRNQDEPIFVRMSDKSSTWSIENGLKALVTTLLAMNMVGYSFIMPDMVGGNGYSNIPTKELFIRWLQANTFMPTIQFSYVPWDYDRETVQIAKKFTSLHYQYSDKILELAKKKVKDGTPINPPIWWVDPSDKDALTIDSEFLLGEDILVAPILDEGELSRDIYLPTGRWQDQLHPEVIHTGRQWLRNYTVKLDELAYFTRIS